MCGSVYLLRCDRPLPFQLKVIDCDQLKVGDQPQRKPGRTSFRATGQILIALLKQWRFKVSLDVSGAGEQFFQHGRFSFPEIESISTIIEPHLCSVRNRFRLHPKAPARRHYISPTTT
jgi:hypothetical protein